MGKINATATFNYPHRNDKGPCFHPGDAVTGHLNLTVKHSMKPKDVAVVFSGWSKTTHTVYNGEHTHSYVEDDLLVEPQVEYNDDENVLPARLESGLIYQWPFSFKLPLETTYVRPQTIIWRKPQAPDPDFEEGPHPLPPSNPRVVTYSVQVWYKGLAPWIHKIILPVAVGQAPVEPSAQLTEPHGLQMDLVGKDRRRNGLQRSVGGRSARVPPHLLQSPVVKLHARLPNDISEPISLAVSTDHSHAASQNLTVVGVDLQVRHSTKSRTFATYGHRNQWSYGSSFDWKHDTHSHRVNVKLPANGMPVTVITEPSFKRLAPRAVGSYTFRTYNTSCLHTMSIIIRIKDDSGRQSAFIVVVPWEVLPVIHKDIDKSSGLSTGHPYEAPSAPSTKTSAKTTLTKKTSDDNAESDSDNDSISSRHVYKVLDDDTVIEVKKPRYNMRGLSKSVKMPSLGITDGTSDDTTSSLERSEEARRGLVLVKHAWWKDETCEDWKHCNGN